MSKKGSAGKIVAGVLATAIVGGAVGGTVAYFQDETFHNKINEIFKIDEAKADSPVNEEKDEYTLSLEQEIERLKNQSLQLKLDYEAKLTEKENSISGLKESLSSVQNELSSKTEELATATETISSLTTQKAEIESELETANSNYAELQEQKTQVDSELKTANETISTLTTQKQSLESQLETANSNYEELQNQKQEVDSELATANETISTLTTQKQNLESQLEIANSNITTITAELEEVESELATANADIETLTSKKAELESKLETANSNYAELQEQKAQVDSELETANETISSLTTQKQSLESQLETANSNISTLTSEKQELETELTSANSQITILTSTKETLEGQLETANSTIETLTTQKQEVEEELEEANGTISSLQNQISTLESDKTSLQNQVSELESDIDDLDSQIVILNAKIAEYEEQLNEIDPNRKFYATLLQGGSLNTFKSDNGDIICCSTNSYFSGLFFINSVDYSITKIYDKGHSWNVFYTLSNCNVLIGCSNLNAKGFLLFDLTTKTVKEFGDTTKNYNYFYQVDNDTCIATCSGIISFLDLNNNTCFDNNELSNYKIESIMSLSNGNALACAGRYTLYIDISNKDFEIVYTSSSHNYDVFSDELSTGIVLIGSTDAFNILKFDISTKTISEASYNGSCSAPIVNFFKLNDDYLIASSKYPTYGSILYDINNDTFSILSTTFSCSDIVQVNENKYICLSISGGFCMFDLTTKKLTQIDENRNYRYCLELSNGKFIVYGLSDVSIYIIDETGSYYDTGSSFNTTKMFECSNGVIICHSKGRTYFNVFEIKFTYGYPDVINSRMVSFDEIGINSPQTQLFDIFTEKDGKVIITSSNNPLFTGLIYDIATDTFSYEVE